MEPQPVDGPIELVLPADTRLVRLVRLLASGLASTADFDVEELDDLRIGVDEVVSALIEGGDGSPLRLRFEMGQDSIGVSGEVPSGSGRTIAADRLELSTQILAAVVDEHELVTDDGRVQASFSKRRGDR